MADKNYLKNTTTDIYIYKLKISWQFICYCTSNNDIVFKLIIYVYNKHIFFGV